MHLKEKICKINTESQATELIFIFYRLAIEVDELGHNDRNNDDEVKRQKAIERKLDCKVFRIITDEQNFNIFQAINEIHKQIKKSTK